MARKKLINGRLLTDPIVLRSKAGRDYCKFEIEFESKLYECLCFNPMHFPIGKIRGEFWKGIIRNGGKDSNGCWFVERCFDQHSQPNTVEVEKPKGLIEDLMNDLGVDYVTKVIREEINDFSRVGFTQQYKMAIARLESVRKNAKDQGRRQKERAGNSENLERDF